MLCFLSMGSGYVVPSSWPYQTEKQAAHASQHSIVFNCESINLMGLSSHECKIEGGSGVGREV